ncbi:release factor glutamine methyltransferase [Iodidimonas muriae]|uniref:Release factor glutamine methyltransferase n=1 Tax=Iodidimonas muriae TaxID=261467 RepID=A0ABQ2LAS6_9PROT|nr:peptide chain release factor N(5)-glutamine methyltransferase [Iodidimonas muriae]GGO08746.1 release factor glutamine methyltransferase [Iodidimonas muriae]
MLIYEAIQHGRKCLAAANVASPLLDAQVLLGHCLDLDRMALLLKRDHHVPNEPWRLYCQLIDRRANFEPVAYLVGNREFCGLDFQLSPATLIPRPDSETLVEAVLAAIADHEAPLRVLDLGTGSGCLLLSLLAVLPKATGVGLDISEDALSMAKTNAKRLDLENRASFKQSEWTAALDPKAAPFDVVLSNPPYISHDDLAQLMPDVRCYEPMGALDGGPDGLDAYRAIIEQIPPFLSADGLLAFELGAGQAPMVGTLLQTAFGQPPSIHKDLAGHDRVVLFRKALRS